MDFANAQLPDTIDVHITDASGVKAYADDSQKKPVIIKLHLPESEAMRAYDNKIHQKTLRRLNKRKSGKITTSLEESRADAIDRLVAFTASIENFVFNGKEVKLENVADIYSNIHLGFISNQLNERLQSYSDFLGE